MKRELVFTVLGKPQPAGSKRAVGGGAGRFTRVVDANKHAGPYKATVGKVAMVAMVDTFGLNPEPLEGPLYVAMEFLLERPKSHRTSTFGISAAGRQFPEPTSKPDVLKLARAVEDGMTGVVFGDDSQITEEYIVKRWGVAFAVHVTVSTR